MVCVKLPLTILLLLFLAVAARAEFLVESTDGPVTPGEIAAFKEDIKAVAFRADNRHNNMVYGNTGKTAEALGLMYEITHDRDILSQFIKTADLMLAGRNDPEKGRILWTGKRELTWPNDPESTAQYLYAGEENGDVIGHICYAAKLILDDKSLWNEKLPDGTTYLDRAKTYVRECDRTIDTYLLPYFVDAKTHLYTSPTSPLFARLGERAERSIGKRVPWNQQMMLNNGFQRLAECHAVLGDDPLRVANYDAIVKASCEAFLASLVHYDVMGHDCVKWSYAADDKELRHIEDAAHGGYDLLIVRHYRSARYGIRRESLIPLANTVMYVMNVSQVNKTQFATRVDGVSKGNPASSLRATYLPLCEFCPELWPLASKAALKRAKGDPLLTATLLWVKHCRSKSILPEGTKCEDSMVCALASGTTSTKPSQNSVGPLAGVTVKAEPPKPLAPVPSTAQLSWQEDELTLFVHFGMNTFTGRSTGRGNEDPKLFNPTSLDCRQWVRTAKEAGFRGIILTAKHHDGFCLWPTKTTEHSVRHSPWKNGQGDVVLELSAACKEYGVKFGIYCSPWDRSQSIYDSDKPAYQRLYRGQLAELLSNYGEIYEIWFDGNKANVAEWPEVIRTVRRLQPKAVIKQGPRVAPILEDLRWVGNEQARAPLTCWSIFPPPDAKGGPAIWFPMECDIPMIGSWFWDGKPPKDLAQLLDIYYTSVGRNSILLLNVAPDSRGLFSDESVRRLIEFRAALDKIFGTDLAAGKKATASNVRGNDPAFGPVMALDGNKQTYWATDDDVTHANLEVDLGGEVELNVIRMEEMISLGQRVEEYRVEAWTQADDKWKTVARGTTIGYRKLDRFPVVKASKVRLTIAARACPAIRSFGVHMDTVSPAESFQPANAQAEAKSKGKTKSNENSATKSGGDSTRLK